MYEGKGWVDEFDPGRRSALGERSGGSLDALAYDLRRPGAAWQ